MVFAAKFHKTPIFRVVKLQLVLTLTACLGVFLSGNSSLIKTLLVGGLSATSVQAFYGWRAFYTQTDSPHKILSDMMRAEMGKYILVGLVLALLLKFFTKLDPLALVISFVFITIAGSVAAAWYFTVAQKDSTNSVNAKSKL